MYVEFQGHSYVDCLNSVLCYNRNTFMLFTSLNSFGTLLDFLLEEMAVTNTLNSLGRQSKQKHYNV